MITKIYAVFTKAKTVIRQTLLKISNPTARIVVSNRIYLPLSVDIEVGEHSELVINKGVRIRKSTLIAVRENASLRIGKDVFINRNCMITARKSITIGNGVTIGPYVSIYDHDHDIAQRGGYFCKEVTIEDNVWIGGNVMILKGVTIGSNSVIAAGSIVISDVPPNTILFQKRQNSFKSISNANQ